MTYTSIFEKILLLINMISTSWIYIAFIIVNSIFIFLLLIKKISKKAFYLSTIISTKLLLLYTTITNYKEISSLVNTITDNLFTNIYFPSIYTYLFVLITINIITIILLLNRKTNKSYKVISSIGSSIINFILILILEVISQNKIDVFTKESLFTNTNLISLLELSINIFILILVGLSANYIINVITERIFITRESRKLVTDPITPINNKLVVENPTIKEDIKEENNTAIPSIVHAISDNNNYEYKFIPTFDINQVAPNVEKVSEFIPDLKTNSQSNIKENDNNYSFKEDTFDLSAFIPKKQIQKPINVTSNNDLNNNILLNQIINNELPIVKEDNRKTLLEEKKNTYTLNDYRIFNKMLKDIREHNQSSSITIDKELEYRLITKYSTETFKRFKTMLEIYSN